MKATIKPILSERSITDAKGGRFTFQVDRRLTKPEIARLVEGIYGVSVVSVATAKRILKPKRLSLRSKKGSPVAVKKAFVDVKEGDKIDVFEAGQDS